jgi:hypothetical protein
VLDACLAAREPEFAVGINSNSFVIEVELQEKDTTAEKEKTACFKNLSWLTYRWDGRFFSLNPQKFHY